jgi:hypothetical protein
VPKIVVFTEKITRPCYAAPHTLRSFDFRVDNILRDFSYNNALFIVFFKIGYLIYATFPDVKDIL